MLYLITVLHSTQSPTTISSSLHLLSCTTIQVSEGCVWNLLVADSLRRMADVEGAKGRAHEDAQNILKSADKKADEALAGSTFEQGAKGEADVKASTTGDKASHATESAKESTGSAWDATKQGSSDAVGTTKEKTGSAWESTKQGTADATDKTKDATGKAWESTKQGTSDAAGATKEKAVQAKDESASLLQSAGEKVKQAASATYDTLDKANRYETYQSKE